VQKADSSQVEVLITLGQIVRVQGDNEAAHTALTEALRLAWAVGPRLLVAAALECLASLAIQTEQIDLAVQLLAGAATLREQMGTPVRPADQRALEHALAIARSNLGDATFAAVWAEVQALPLEQILSTIPSAAAFATLSDQPRR